MSGQQTKNFPVSTGSNTENLLKGISDGFIALDREMRFTYVNPAASAILGVDVEKIIGQHLWEVFPGAGFLPTCHAAEKALNDGLNIVVEDYLVQNDTWFENHIYPNRNGLSIFITDISARKNKARRESLMAEITDIFNQPAQLPDVLKVLLNLLMKELNAKLAEAWLTGLDPEYMMLNTQVVTGKLEEAFFSMQPDFKKLTKGKGLPGIVWATERVEVWNDLPHNNNFLRSDAAATVGINTGVGIPLFFNSKVIGVLLFGFDRADYADPLLYELAEMFTKHLGAEIKRKQLEGELKQVINGAPDIICVVGLDRRFKKVNSAMSNILRYSEEELQSLSIDALIHPDDLDVSRERMKKFRSGESRFMYFENRYVRKDGEVVFLGWTVNKADDEGVLFCMAKDITEKKMLEGRLQRTSEQARMGSWEVNLENGKLSWSPVTGDILELKPGLDINSEGATLFHSVNDATFFDNIIKLSVESGHPFDVEQELVTFNNNKRWVRITGEGCFQTGKCSRVFGSLQDIDQRKRAELAANQLLKERNSILESIGDGFFSVDNNFRVTYWNKTAAMITKTSKNNIVGKKLWDNFSPIIGSVAYNEFNAAMAGKDKKHFEYYYEALQKWFDISAYPSPSGLSVFFRDISDRKKADAVVAEQRRELLESHKRYSYLFQLSPLPKFIYDTETLRFLDVTQSMVEHYGYSREELLNMTLRDIRPPELLPQMERAVKKAANTDRFHQPEVFTHKKKDGSLIQVEIESRALQFMGKSARMSVVTDVTEKLKYLHEIETQNKALREISWIQSHIVRAPLARLVGLVGLLENAISITPEQQQIMSYLRQSANELDSVIQDITQNANIGIAE